MLFLSGLINYFLSENQSKINLEPLEPLACDIPIFDYLDGKDLRACSLVCKRWRTLLSSDYAMQTLWHRVATDEFPFGPTSYLRFFNKKCINVPRLHENIVKTLNENCPIFGGKVYQHWILTYVPDCFEDGTSLNLNTLKGLVQVLVDGSGGHATKYRDYDPNVKNQFGDQSLAQSRWVLMSRTVVSGTRDQPFEKQKALVQELCEKHKITYHIPESALEVAVSVLTHHTRTGERLLNYKPWTYTRCQQQVLNHPLVVGGFSPDGLNVHCLSIGHEFGGVVLVREVL